jgi:hypothetical protein
MNVEVILHEQDEASIKTAALISTDLFDAATQFGRAGTAIFKSVVQADKLGSAGHADAYNAIDRVNIDAIAVTRDIVSKLLRRATDADAITILAVETAFNQSIVELTHQLQEDERRRSFEQQAINDVSALLNSSNDGVFGTSGPVGDEGVYAEITEEELLRALRLDDAV